MMSSPSSIAIAIVGGGPAGLAAAELLSRHGFAVDIFDAMPSLGRKFLMAGRGGLNLTHGEPAERFCRRFGLQQQRFMPWLAACSPQSLRNWAASLGVETFVGSSGRVFPREMKAAPLLRAWLHRLRAAGVRIHVRHAWLGWHENGALRFAAPAGEALFQADAVLLALGGGSWPQLGSDGRWADILAEKGVAIAPLRPANCGFDVPWSEFFRDRFAGEPIKNVAASCIDASGQLQHSRGECVVTAQGIEGGLVYALSAFLRDGIAQQGSAQLVLDLLPDMDAARVRAEVKHPRGARSLSTHLKSRVGIHGVKAGLLREVLSADEMNDAECVARTLKALPLTLAAARPLEEAISTAGGVDFAELDQNLMLSALPGVFCAGEMLDWEAPTGGYLLTGCIATGQAAARGMMAWLALGTRPA